MRYPLVDGQGNFGSIDGDNRGRDAIHRGSPGKDLTNEVLADIEKETVDFQPNYDESLSEPKVMPTRIPLLARQRFRRHRGRNGDENPAA